MKKYEMTNEVMEYSGRTLHRIKRLSNGKLGGWIEVENNLSQDGYCWIKDEAIVYGTARISDNAIVYGNTVVCNDAKVYGNAVVYNNAVVCCHAKVHGNAIVCNDAKVYGNAEVYGNANIREKAIIAKLDDYIVFKNWWSSGCYFTWTRSNNLYSVGCFLGTGEELIEDAYRDSINSGDNYKAIVDYVNNIVLKQTK